MPKVDRATAAGEIDASEQRAATNHSGIPPFTSARSVTGTGGIGPHGKL